MNSEIRDAGQEPSEDGKINYVFIINGEDRQIAADPLCSLKEAVNRVLAENGYGLQLDRGWEVRGVNGALLEQFRTIGWHKEFTNSTRFFLGPKVGAGASGDAGQEGTEWVKLAEELIEQAAMIVDRYEINDVIIGSKVVILGEIRALKVEVIARHVPVSAPVPPDEITTRCVECESVHFNVKWSVFQHLWQICCEGCGCIHQLIPTGSIQLRRKA